MFQDTGHRTQDTGHRTQDTGRILTFSKVRLFTFLLFAFSLVLASSVAAYADHTHGDITFTAWDNTTNLPTSAGSYYLTADVTLSSPWSVPNGTTNLCLNGHGITLSSSDDSDQVIRVQGGSSDTTLNLYDCNTTTTHQYTITDGLAAVNDSTGDTPFTGGYITGGKGAGIYVLNNVTQTSIKGIFKMYGGTILGNAGGVESTYSGTFELHAGTIIGNRAEVGGGVCVSSGGSFTMTGGSITRNTARTTTRDYGDGYVNTSGGEGGGVYVMSRCAFTMSGGSITSNQADKSGGGVYVGGGSSYSSEYTPATLNISSNVIITGNTNTANTPASSNVFLGKDNYGSNNTYDAVITIKGALGTSSRIGVTLADGHNSVFTSGFSGKGSADNFASDNTDYSVEADGNELKLALSAGSDTAPDSTTDSGSTPTPDDKNTALIGDVEKRDALTIEDYLKGKDATALGKITKATIEKAESLTSLEGIKKLENLTTLNVSDCAALETADLSGLANLTEVTVKDCDKLKTLDVSGCGNLERLDCGGDGLEGLNITGCVKLAALDCSLNCLTSLDISNSDFPSLASLVCDGQTNDCPEPEQNGSVWTVDLSERVGARAEARAGSVRTASASKVLRVTGIDDSGAEMEGEYDPLTGTAGFPSRPGDVKYWYDTGYNDGQQVVSMDVTLTGTESDPVSGGPHSGCGNGCNTGFMFGSLAALLGLTLLPRRKRG